MFLLAFIFVFISLYITLNHLYITLKHKELLGLLGFGFHQNYLKKK
jgi:hypothetical protein